MMASRSRPPRNRSHAASPRARSSLTALTALRAPAALLVLALSCAAGTQAASAQAAGATAGGAATAHPESGVRVAQAWIRWLPANLPAGGYLTLVNEGTRPAVLVAVSSPAYVSVALHRTLSSGGTTRMVPVSSISLAPHTTLDFASLGYHLMLTQTRASVQPGQSVPLTLRFADGGTLQVSAAVKPPAAEPGAAPAGKGMQGMPGMADMPNMPGMSH